MDIAVKVDQLLNEYMSKESIPGLAVGIVRNHQIIYTKGFGVKNAESKEPLDEYSLFHMASVSKTFVAAGIMQLVEQGSIHLDSPVVELLPHFRLHDDRYKDITIRHLLSHRSAIPNEKDLEWDKPQYEEDALEKYVAGLKDKKLLHKPGESFSYSDTAYEILGEIIAKVSGISFEQYMKDNILNVIGMKESDFFVPAVSKELLTSPHLLYVEGQSGAKVSRIYPYNRIHSPSSTLCSNVVEMCNYAIANINQGEFEGQQILAPGSYSVLWQEEIGTGWGGHTTEMGLSWFLGEYKGYRVMSHLGGDTGYRAEFMIAPDAGAAVVIMTNSDYVATERICTSILDIVLGEEPADVRKSLAHSLAITMLNHSPQAAFMKYKEIQQHSIEEYIIREGEFDDIASLWSKEKRNKQAVDLLKIAIDIWPESSTLNDRLVKLQHADQL
ncbi:serine hydrolase domain-containing protein [Paenibacillus tengchongensis]|uniref:serine hydrolase domain-containing protein n=1 Tax=Paenibacillus tengchongensis TaxID=2608684 RepID=UPI00124CCE81|nr:serine hydrolase domain-containing protein [Paenibacillus tengchongensis]